MSTPSLSRSDIIAGLREILSERIDQRGMAIDEQTNLFEVEILDSFAIVELIGGMEDRFAIAIAVEDLDHETFGRLDRMAELVLRLKAP